MEPFVTHTGKFITFDRANVDTDAIIPARFPEKIERVGFGELLFRDLRQVDGKLDPGFPLNRPEARDATVLVAWQNFGCGSSREHAVWAISQAGFRAVIAPRMADAPGFADIFRNNSYKNGLLPVEVSEAFADRLFQAGTGQVTIDLRTKTVTGHFSDGEVKESFPIPDGTRALLLEGLDDISLTIQQERFITAYEAQHPEIMPLANV